MIARRAGWHWVGTALLGLLAASAVSAQTRANREEEQPAPPPRSDTPPAAAGHVAGSAVGQAGQRQRRGQAVAGIDPLGRIANRIDNRIRSRLHNRIDRNYDPLANAASPFTVAGEETRSPGRTRRR